MDASDFGRYGALSVLKQQDTDMIVASYPIDELEITLGRHPTCSIRLYYAEVSAVHCRVVFNDEGKAFLVVLGTNGLVVDNCAVFPSPPGHAPTTVPLPNNSILELHNRRFRFAYPPKHLRPAFAALPPTPIASPGTRRRALRMSMITSAKVFSPRPFEDPRKNLQVLQSPLKAAFKPDPESDDEGENDEQGHDRGEPVEEAIVLVESDHPRVVESDKDLVILDHVTVTEPPPSTTSSPYRSPHRSPARMLVPPQNWAPPRTPAKRLPRPSLHRAVLIKSAQRAALRQEMQWEEEAEAEEVESIMDEDEEMEDVQEEEEYEEEVKGETEQRRTPMSGWRKSLEAVKGGLGWAFRAASVEVEERPTEDIYDEHGEDVQEYQEYEGHQIPEHSDEDMPADGNDENIYPNLQDELSQQNIPGPATPEIPSRPLGRFMTPQASSVFPRPSAQPRYSMGGSTMDLGSSVSGPGVAGPRRVRVVEPWKVSEIVVRPIQEEIKTEKETDHAKEERAQSVLPPASSGGGTPRRDGVSEEEKRTIRERRKSALKTPDNFFGGGIPGSRRMTLLPPAPIPALFPTTAVSTVTPSIDVVPSTSPKKEYRVPLKTEDGVSAAITEEDPGVLLARMRQMIDGVKRRQSVEVNSPRKRSSSPKKRSGFSLLAEEPGKPTQAQRHRHRDAEDVIMEEQEQAMRDEDDMPVAAARTVEIGTPQMNDLRHLFGAGGGGDNPSTPRLTGVREMFLHAKEPAGLEESALEGVGEMMATPVGWRAKAGERDMLHERSEDLTEPAPSRVATSKGAGAARRRTPRSVAARKETAAPQLVAVDIAASTQTKLSGPRVVRRTRTHTSDGDQEGAGMSTSRVPRSRQPRTEEEDEVPELPSKTKSALRRRTGTTSDVSEDEAATGSRPVRRTTRSVSAEPEGARKTPTSPASTASARRARVTRKVPSAEATKPSSARRSARSRAGEHKDNNNVDDNDDNDDEDPLDSIATKDQPAVPDAARVRRATRRRIPVGGGKEEEEGATLPASDDEEPARTTRGRKPPSNSGLAKNAAASGSSSTTKGPYARAAAGASGKNAATAHTEPTPAAEGEGSRAGDKENTPGPQDEDEGPAAPAGVNSKVVAKSRAPPRSGARAKATRSSARAEAEEAETGRDAYVTGTGRASRAGAAKK